LSENNPNDKSKAQLLAEHINKKLDNNEDLATLDGRKKDFAEFTLENKPITFTKSHYLDILKRELKRRNIDAKAYGLQSRSPTFIRKTGDMNTTLTTHPSKVESKNITDQKNIKQITELKKDKDGKIIQQTATEQEKKELISDYRINFNEQNVGITIKALYNILKLKYPNIEGLTDEEKEILGELWLPAFQKYFAENYAIIIIPVISTLTLLAPKISKAKKEQKKKKKDTLEKEIAELEKKKDGLKNN